MIKRLCVVNRKSASHLTLNSRSISARLGPMLDYLSRNNLIAYELLESNQIDVDELLRFDAVFFNKHVSQKDIEIMRLAKYHSIIAIYDIDDWILELPQYSVTRLTNSDFNNIIYMIENSDVVITSSNVIKDKLSSLRKNIILIPNSFDHDAYEFDYSKIIHRKQNKVLFANTDDIKLIKFRNEFINTLNLYLEMNPNIILDFWGDVFPEMLSIKNLVYRGFTENRKYKNLIKAEGYLFALVPLGGEEDPESLFFNSCKSCLKYIDYGSLGIPGIYSDSPVYSNVIQSFENGLLVDNSQESWLNAMQTLTKNLDLRNKIVRNSYLDCRRNYNSSISSMKLLKIINKN